MELDGQFMIKFFLSEYLFFVFDFIFHDFRMHLGFQVIYGEVVLDFLCLFLIN
jgi:hypothetical protein